MEWFKEDQLYHLIGFIIGQKIKTINVLWQESKEAKRDQFVQILKSHIQRDYLERLFKVNKDSTRLDFTKVDYLSSSQRPRIIGLLMLFNIYINEKHKTRFSFRAYNNCQWDIEHIHAQQSKEMKEKEAMKKWLEDTYKAIEHIQNFERIVTKKDDNNEYYEEIEKVEVSEDIKFKMPTFYKENNLIKKGLNVFSKINDYSSY